MQRILIDGYEYIKGPIAFEPRNVFDLKTGDRIKSIGVVGSKSSSSRCQLIEPYMTYMGVLTLSEGAERLGFQLPTEGVTGWSLFNLPEPVFKLYKFDEFTRELYCTHYEQLTILIYKAIFGKECKYNQ